MLKQRKVFVWPRGSTVGLFWIALILGLFIHAEVANAFWGKSPYEKGNDYLAAEQYDKAIIEYEKALSEKTVNPSVMAIASNMGVAYHYMWNYEKATEYYLMSINAMPDRGYYGYVNLAVLNYQNGKIQEAYEYSLKAKQLVNSPRYYEIEKIGGYNRDLAKHTVIAENEFFKMRLSVQELNAAYKLSNYNKAIELAEDILQINYHANFGIGFAGNTIVNVQEGSIADINGLVKGDKVLNLDGKPIGDNFVDAYNTTDQLFDKYGSTINIIILRKGREIPIECKLIYPEIEQTQQILNEIKVKIKNKSNKNTDKVAEGPWLKVLEPKSARGIKIVGNQSANFVILASGKDEIKTVTVNDSACSVSEANPLEKTILPGKVNKYTVSLPLLQGKNKYIVKATDIKGKTTQQQIEVEGNETLTKELDKIYDHKVAVVIGINKYNPWPGLEYAVNDAEAVRNKLRKMGYDKIIELYNRQATRTAILRVLGDDLLTTLGPNDSLLVYFAGHGQTESLADGQEEGYIIPVDGALDNYQGTAISMTYIHSMIKKYRAKHILFAFDSCYSGLGLKRGGGKKPVDAFMKNMSQKKVRQILTAGGKDEQAAEEKGHGVFSKAFLDALEIQNSGINKDGYTLASDLGQFVRKQVGEKTQFKQTPMFGWLDGEGDFIFDLNQSGNEIFVAAAVDAVAPVKPVKKAKKAKKAVAN